MKHLVTEKPSIRYKESRRAYAIKNAWKQPEYHQRYIQRNPEQRLVTVARQRSIKRNIDFDLTKDDFIVPEYCPILGLKLQFHFGSHGGRPNSPSLDRIDNTKGYIKGNVQVISHLANSMKSTANKEQLKKFAKWVLKNG